MTSPSPGPGPGTAGAPRNVTSWCEVQALPPSAYAATTTSTPGAAITTSR
ncbi:MAG: hypothetical protein ACLP7F_05695 [Acidimicrobiales bacterium]